MFGIGIPEIIIIAAVALIFIGPDKLPGVLRSIGKGLVEIKRATSDVRSTMQNEMQKIEEEIELSEVRKSAEDFSNEFGGVTNKINPLSLSKLNNENQLEKEDTSLLESENNDLNKEKDLKQIRTKSKKNA